MAYPAFSMFIIADLCGRFLLGSCLNFPYVVTVVTNILVLAVYCCRVRGVDLGDILRSIFKQAFLHSDCFFVRLFSVCCCPVWLVEGLNR